MPKIARIAYVVAFTLAGFTVISGLTGQIIILPAALIPLIAGIGIMHKRVWSAYGIAVYEFAQLLLLAVVLFRSGGFMMGPPGTIAGAVLICLLVPLFFVAGRSLALAGGQRGWAWPWIALSALTTFPIFFVQAFVIPTGAMEDTILIGDRILVQRFPKPNPERGGMIVFVYPIDRRQTFVKRVIGVPGDHIRMAGKVVYRNGTALSEPYAVHKTDYVDSYRDNFPSEASGPFTDASQMLKEHVVNGELIVPEGKCFVLGDNRDLSLDSRYWGFVGSNDLIGKPLLIYDSEDQEAGKPLGGKSARSGRFRWDRFFKRL